MFRPVSLYIGLRYTRAKRRNHFISFISLTSILGLTLGVMVLIVVLSVMNGFDRELQRRILGMVPQASIVGYQPFSGWEDIVANAEQHAEVEGAAPFIQLQGLLSNKGAVDSAFISGIHPDYESRVSILPQHLKSGSLTELQSGSFNIILGSALARKLGLAIGDKVTLVLPEAAVTPAGIIPRFKRFTVAGTFQVGAELDGMVGFINLEDAARLARMKGKVEGVRLKVKDLFSAGRISWDLATKQEGQFYATDWTRTHGTLFQAIKMEKTMMALLLLLIVAVAAFNIVSSLVMVVTDKKSDIAILRTLGASPGTIMGIFMVQGSFIGVIGTLAGTALGVTVALNISDFALWLEQVLNTKLFEQYFVNYLPSELRWENVIFVSSMGFLMSFAATLYPARKASKVQPAEALRYE
ncbi:MULTISPECIES: lipoprotein-releasing ABC transporter permease subunit [unclassified Ketobacter]|uniref:lipoprotein-releasing ABC transporter permease subunit n=1 Tax=unclassified Ketobacter TaxID=2639109 RepID=UPI000F265B2B|nr:MULTISPECIES: lipoprotein-releasing ABC transporter permease subunit [unclassified Ketobacter]RLT89928.1 MAG: lipoprotein-releasing ABC transporter permease subunit [Ketobacter sp. GenoA1]RLT99188.1 MAG: lipoprotein-releasing ABC transporter permease subunit [Ketobacter sp.]